MWVGTRDGLYRFARQDGVSLGWRLAGPFLPGTDVFALAHGPDGAIFAGTRGDGLFRSSDGGSTWRQLAFDARQAELNAHYAAYQCPIVPNGTAESSVWSLAVSPHDSGTVYAGVLPAALFRSTDGGDSWEEVAGLRRMPQSREFWGPFHAPFLHTIELDPGDPDRLTVGISVGGVFGSIDGGDTWQVLTDGMEEWVPEGARYPEVHKDVHKLRASPVAPRRLYTTEHGPWLCRSDDGGGRWRRLPVGEPNTVTRPLALHPRDPDRLWLALLSEKLGGDSIPRAYGQLRVLESRDGGTSWQERSAGLPAGDCNVFREALAADDRDPAGIYLGTSRGDLFAACEGCPEWGQVAAGLLSVRVVLPEPCPA